MKGFALAALALGLFVGAASEDASAAATPGGTIYIELQGGGGKLGARSAGIWAVKPDGSGLRWIMKSAKTLTPSSDGKRLYCTYCGKFRFGVLSARGGKVREIPYPESAGGAEVALQNIGVDVGGRGISGIGSITFNPILTTGVNEIVNWSPKAGIRQIYGPPADKDIEYHPVLVVSPDGGTAVFSHESIAPCGFDPCRQFDLIAVDTATGASRRVFPATPSPVNVDCKTGTGIYSAHSPVKFSRDGRRLLFVTSWDTRCVESQGTTPASEYRVWDVATGATTLLPAFVTPFDMIGTDFYELSPSWTHYSYTDEIRGFFSKSSIGLFTMKSDGTGKRRILPPKPRPGVRVADVLLWSPFSLDVKKPKKKRRK